MCPQGPNPDWVPPALPFPALPHPHGDDDLVVELGDRDSFANTLPMPPAPPGILGLCPIESVQIAARMLLQPWTSYSIGDESIELMCHCDRIAETWVRVTITTEQLGEMLAAILATRANTEPDVYDVIRAICKRY